MYRTVATIAILAAVLAAGCTGRTPAEFMPKVMSYSGEVTVDGKSAHKDLAVRDGAVVRTGDASFCNIVFMEKNVIRVMEKSEVVVSISDEKKYLDLRSGAVAHVLKKLAGPGKRESELFRVTTPTATASVRGTVFFVKVESPDRTYVCDCNGVITITGPNGAGRKKIEAAHHKAYTLMKTGSGIDVREAGLLYHDDCGTEKLAETVGFVIDWNLVDTEVREIAE